jgi:hypothetical protein
MAIMQTFRVESGDEISEYVYLTKIDLFFKQKSPTFGITLDIGDVENGYPTADMVPNGKVHLKASEVNISTDGQTATTFTFSSPLCVPTGGEFALNIMADNQNPDYILWLSKLGQSDVSTSQPINKDSFSGHLLLSSGAPSLPRPILEEDIKFTVYRAEFTANTGTIALQNKDYDYLTVNSINGTFKQGELVFLSNASAQTTGTVTMTTSNSTVTGTGTSFDTEYAAGQYLTFANTTAHDTIQINSVTNSTSLILKGYPLISNTSGIAVHHTPVGKVFFYDSTDTYLYLEDTTATNSTFKFSASASIIGAETGANATVQSVDDKTVSYFEPLLYKTAPPLTDVLMYTHANTASGDTGNTQYRTNDRSYFKDNAVIKSKSNDLTGKFKQYFTLSTKNNIVSPTVDLSALSTLIYENIINNDTTNEHLTGQGSATCKYISRVVTLDDGLDAEDLRVYLTAFKPGADNADIKVYGKILSELDTDLFGDRHWTELELVGQDERSGDDNRLDYREYIYQIPQTPASTFVEKGATTDGSAAITTASDVSSTLTAGTLVKVTNSDSKTDYQIDTVKSASGTTITLDQNLEFTNTGASIDTVTLPQTAFKDPQNAKVATYFNSGGTKFSTYKVFAVKIVMLSDDTSTVPAIKDYRALALSV